MIGLARDAVGTPSASRVFVGIVDVILVALLVVAGQLHHGVNPIADPVTSAGALIPFVVGWLVVAPLAGIYATRNRTSPSRALRLTTVTWIAAANVGLILRQSPLFDGGTAWPFALVMTGTGLLVLVSWRVGYAVTR